MANKRLTDRDKWRKPFVRNLSLQNKLFWIYLLDKCSNAGIWDIDFELANFELGFTLNQEEIKEVFKDKFVYIDEGKKWYIPSFVEFQQPKGLKANNNAHDSIIKELKKYNLPIPQYQEEGWSGPEEDLTSPPCNSNSNSTGNSNGTGLLYDEKFKDFDKFAETFPQGKRDYDPHSLTIWENLSQRDKDLCLQLTPHYVEYHTKTGKEKYIKNIRKFLEEGFWKQLNEFQSRFLGKKVLIQNSNTSETPEQKKERLDKLIWG